MAGNGPNQLTSSMLLQQIQTLSDLQNSGTVHHADPAAQAAYIRKLEQQADSIRQLLKLLNNTGSSTQPAYQSSSEDMAPGRLEEEEGYEQLWELGTNCNGSELGGEPTEVGEEEDFLEDFSLEDQRDLYENTSSIASGLVGVEVPPPLPPRLPSRLASSGRPLPASDRSLTGSDQSAARSQDGAPGLPRAQPVYAKSSRASSGGDANYDNFAASRTLDCSSPQVSLHSRLTSTPRDNDSPLRLANLRQKREELLSSLQTEEQEKQWHYTQLELIAQTIRHIPM